MEESVLKKPLYFPRQSTSLMQPVSNYYQITNGFYKELEQKMLQFIWRHTRPWIAKKTLRKKTAAGRTRIFDFRLYYKATVIKGVRYWCKKRNIVQRNRIESLEISSHTYGHLIYDKGGKNIQWRKDSLINMWCCKNWTATCKQMKLEHSQHYT